MTQKPKLLFFINTLNFGGAERVVSQLLNNLTDEYELHLAVYTAILKYDIPEQVRLFDLKENVDGANMKTLLRLPIVAKKLSVYCKENEIETVVSFLNRPCYVSAIMRNFWGFKGILIMCERSHQSSILSKLNGVSVLFRSITKYMVNYAYQRADLVLTNSKVSRADLIRNFKITKQIEVIYNPIDISLILEKSKEAVPLHFDPELFYFISTGNFRVEKNFSLLIEAFAQIAHLPVRLLLVGGGALEEKLKMQAELLNISSKIIFTGFQNNPYKYIAKCNCFVLSSNTEGFPNVLLEALACGKPLISTDCLSGPRELLAPESDISKQIRDEIEFADYGVLVPVNNAQLLAEAMKKIMQETSLREVYETKAKTRVSKFDISTVKQLFLTAFSYG